MNKEYRSLNEDYEKQQTFVVTEIIQIAHGYVPYIAELGHLCSKLDCLVRRFMEFNKRIGISVSKAFLCPLSG